MAAVFLALSLKAFLALEHKTPIIDAAHKALIGSCWTPKGWKKPPALNLEPFTDAEEELCSGLGPLTITENAERRQLRPFKAHKTAVRDGGRLCVLWKPLTNSGRKQPPGQICHCGFTHDRIQTRSGSRASWAEGWRGAPADVHVGTGIGP